MRKAATAIILSIAFLTLGAASSDWNIDVLNEPYSFETVSNTSQTIQVINLTTVNGKTISEKNITDTSRVEYKYNGSTRDMNWLYQGYWYATFTTNMTAGKIEFEAQGETTSSQMVDSQGTEANATRNLNVSNISIQMLKDINGTFTAGEQVDVEVNLTDLWNQDNIEGSEGDAFIYFTNVSWTSNKKKLGYSNGVHQLSFKIPEATNETYILHVNATDTADSYEASTASLSRKISTYPSVEGEIQYLNTSTGCDQENFFNSCEPGTTFETGYNITNAEAENVNLVMMAENSTGMNETINSTGLAEQNGLRRASLTIPDLNTSEYGETIYLKYNASNRDREDIDYHSFEYRPYKIDAGNSPNTAYQGGQYTIKAAFEKPYTKTPIDHERVEKLNATVTRPNGSEFSRYQLEDMTYDSEEILFKKSFHVPMEANTDGVWTLNITAFNLYNHWETDGDGFSILDVSATFNTSNEVDVDYDKTGIMKENLTITNQVNSVKELNLSISGEVEDFTTYNKTVEVPGSDTVKTPLKFNITRVEDYSGEVKVIDTDMGYNETVELNLDAPNCEHRNETLCIQEPEDDWINITRTERGHNLGLVKILYLGEKNTTTDGKARIISRNVDAEPEEFPLNDTHDSETITLNFTTSTPGNFTNPLYLRAGNDTFTINTHFEARIEPRNYGITVSSPVNVGYIPVRDSAEATFEIENTGKTVVENIQTGDSTAELSGPSSLTPGETGNYTISVESFEGEFDVKITGETVDETVSDTLTVTGKAVPNIPSKADSLQSRLDDISSNATTPGGDTKTDVDLQLTSAITSYQRGNYEEAMSTYNEVKTKINQLENSGSSPTEEPENTTEETNNTEEEGGGGILPLLIGLIVILLIGFIAYSSIIPEEGDPLYNVLGQ